MNKEREVTCELCSILEHEADVAGEPHYMQPLARVRYSDTKEIEAFNVYHEGEIYEVRARHVRAATNEERDYVGDNAS